MAAEIEMSYPAMDRAADAQADARTKVSDIESVRQGATLPEGSLGRLPESGEIQQTFDEAWSSLGESLAILEQAFDGIAVRLTNIRRDHLELDGVIGDTFGGAAGGGN